MSNIRDALQGVLSEEEITALEGEITVADDSSAAVPDPFTPTDGTWNVTGSVAASADITVGGVLDHDGATAGFYGATPVTQQVSGADLTNNVTVGGTNDQIDDWTDLTTYATDAAAIRNAVFQLARKLKQVNDALRALGILT